MSLTDKMLSQMFRKLWITIVEFPEFSWANVDTASLRLTAGKRRSSPLRNLFSTILALPSAANPKLALRAQTVGFADTPGR
jgi:hypothetical protein